MSSAMLLYNNKNVSLSGSLPLFDRIPHNLVSELARCPRLPKYLVPASCFAAETVDLLVLIRTCLQQLHRHVAPDVDVLDWAIRIGRVGFCGHGPLFFSPLPPGSHYVGINPFIVKYLLRARIFTVFILDLP